MFAELAQQYKKPFFPITSLPAAKEREFWDGLEPALSKKLVKNGREYLGYPYSVIRATDYLEFSRTGNREHYEEKQFSRRTALNTLVLAECVENQGVFMDDILNGIYAICEESGWQLPPHNAYVRDAPQLPLPDVTRPVVDLFCAETGAVLAVVRHLLKQKLDAVTPAVDRMICDALDRRLLTPYQNEHFWWMGDGVSHMNNWTIWCTQNVLLAAFLGELSETRRREIFLKACRSIDYFLDEYGDDGCCDEGAQYYRHAGLCLFGCMEILNEVTGGLFLPLYQNAKLCNIAAYILNVHVDGGRYINFSDCSPAAGRCNAREFLFGKRTGNPELMRLAALDYKEGEDPLLTAEHNLFYRLLTIRCHREMTGFPTNSPVSHQDIFYPSVGLFIVRDSRFCLAAKAGDNDDSHNHNDTGSFTIYKDGKPMFADIGVETYQKKTFSPRRYEIWTMQSQYHNLPGFLGPEDERLRAAHPFACLDAGEIGQMTAPPDDKTSGNMFIQQDSGAAYRARNVEYDLSGSCPFLSMDIAGAYPTPRLSSYCRRITMQKGTGILVADTADCDGLTPVLSLITYEEPSWDAPSSTLTIGDLGTCRMEGAGAVRTERLPITDKRLQTAWKHDMWRTLVVMKKNRITLDIR